MLILPSVSPVYRILGIDPGTNTLGVAILDINLSTLSVDIVHAKTYSGQTMSGDHRWFEEVHGGRASRLKSHQENLYAIMVEWNPHFVIAESPYMRKFPQAFAALVECVMAIRAAVIQYDRFMPLALVDPPTAKKSAGMVGKLSGKELVRIALRKLTYLNYAPGIDLEALDEHEVDAIAVAHHRAKEILGILRP
jgi:Holliday junction resolvasome RuvABC endonuclease subunit